MKKIYFILLLLISQQLLSQHASTGIGKWKLGLNVGATWQTADISTDLFDLGYGATLEFALYEKRSSFFGFSLRGRFLQGKTTGYDYLSNGDPISNNAINGINDTTFNYSFSPFYLNNKTSLNEFSLEAMLKWNSLYQNHGILFYLYLGGGFTSYKVETDQLNANNDLYDYALITNNNGSSTVKEIKNLQDGNYETELIHPNYNTLVFTPAVGVGLGFRITPGVDFAFEHKISLPQTDLFDGQIHDSGDPSFIQDIYHYTSLGIIFSIIGHTEPETYTPYVEPTEPVIPTTPLTTTPIKPIITITQPTINTFNTPNCSVEIVAKIENIKEQKNIDFYHNGIKVPSYKYFYTPTTFKSNVELAEGNNSFKIIATNGNLNDIKEFSLKCNNVNTIDVCHKKLDGNYITLNIKESEWNDHKSHGDSKGACPEKQLTICHNISGQPGKTQTISIAESTLAIHISHGDYEGSCNEKTMITICHNNQELTIDQNDWPTHAAHGDTQGPCPQQNMITICHIPTTGNQRELLTIPENEWIIHQAHGDSKGACPSIEPTITICHKNSNGIKSTIEIPEFRWNEHFSHGDSKGACPQSSFIICHKDPATGKKQNISIYESGWAAHAAHGDLKEACPIIENQITICHNIPGKPGKTQSITIPESKWSIHKSHGDKLGKCIIPEKYIQICHNSGTTKSNISIKESEWATHAAHGDTKGSCPIIEKQIIICHNIPGQPGKTETITIPESKWSIHKSHGDKLGKCIIPEKYIQICHNSGTTKSNISIKESEWATHAAHGDTKGSCPINELITICHINQTNGDLEPMTITQSELVSHLSHGDLKGSCSKFDQTLISICHNNKNLKIKTYLWPFYEAKGGTKGICDVADSSNNKITICHYPPGNNGNPQTIQISQNAWPAHQAHGDSQGECPSNSGGNSPKGNIDICHLDQATGVYQTINIPAGLWQVHQAHGDTQGGCPENKKKK